ncbi:hypothetical protein [Cohnella nanjingensis]|uniref:hypothetical protein n=1 Tax=Cohnella nanjingensis TaxID=1387779 RepID=UPI001FE24524|nr:hypothetical protein [Cohnella nanjingensis]
MERNLKDRLFEKSHYGDETKEEIWSRLEAQLDREPVVPAIPSRKVAKRSKKTMRKMQITTVVAAVLLAIGVFLAMPAGTAFMKDAKSWFAPEKKVEIQIEGEKEQTDQKLHKNEESRYVIYYDKERYKLVQQEGKDVITTKEPLPEKYPEVSLTIEQYKDLKPEELIKRLSEALAGKYSDVREVEKVSEPLEGYRVRALNGTKWDSEVVVIYVADNRKQGSFALTEKYFMEASEGHSARFEQMLKQFKVLEE